MLNAHVAQGIKKGEECGVLRFFRALVRGERENTWQPFHEAGSALARYSNRSARWLLGFGNGMTEKAAFPKPNRIGIVESRLMRTLWRSEFYMAKKR